MTEQTPGFSGILGQEGIIEHLQRAIRMRTVSHAYLLVGEKEAGREQLAEALAQTMQCREPVEKNGRLEPCGLCHDCMQAQASTHPDIQHLQHAKPNLISVEEIRSMCADVQIKPYQREHKFYIISDAEKMNAQAQNALLKTLEEPPAYAHLLLLTSGENQLLPTVLSRCVMLKMQPASDRQIASWLTEEKGIAPGRAALFAGFSDGNPGRALQMAEDENFLTLCTDTARFLYELPRMDSYQLAQKAAEYGEKKETLDLYLSFLQSWYRDVLLCKASGKAENLIFAEDIKYSKEAAGRMSYEGLKKCMEAFETARRRKKAGTSGTLVLESLFLTLRECSSAQNTGRTAE